MKKEYRIGFVGSKTTDAHDGFVHKFLMVIHHEKGMLHFEFYIPELYKVLKEKSIRMYDGKDIVTAYKNNEFKMICDFLKISQKNLLNDIWHKYKIAMIYAKNNPLI
tara:strand:+ start:21532 stop:21852 length:321 start_codon:yes stop_codon:yes gene_type:complete